MTRGLHPGVGISNMPTTWSDDHAELGLGDKRAFRPTIMGTNGMVSTGHYLSTLVGIQVLQQGGNAVDAGVLDSGIVSFGGVVGMLLDRGDLHHAFTIVAVGHGAELGSLEYFRDH